MALVRLLSFAFLAILAFAAPRVFAQTDTAAAPRVVMLADAEGVVGPPMTHHIETAIGAAEERNAEALILRMNTPGGLETSTRDIIRAVLASRVPVIVYVAPAGGRAASAGAYILYASHLAAMSPGTNVGAATPVQMGGGGPESDAPEEAAPGEGEAQPTPEPSDTLDRKAVNDAAAFMRSLAELRGRNAEWAEAAVRGAVAVSASEALELGVIEIVARDVDDLLAQADGRSVSVNDTRTLQTQGALIERVEPSFVTNMLAVLANPNVAFLLMMVGVYGLIYEFASPGSVGPGVIGAVCLVLGLYALNQLPLNYAGVALIVLGIAFMVAEAFAPSFGILGIGGAIAFLIGGGMLIDTDIPQYQLSWPVLAAAAAMSGGFLVFALGFTLRAHARRSMTGREALIGQRVQVIDWAAGKGHVWAHSERWSAIGPDALAMNATVRITGVDGLTLKVAADSQGETS